MSLLIVFTSFEGAIVCILSTFGFSFAVIFVDFLVGGLGFFLGLRLRLGNIAISAQL
jgi:hypothetical protein